MSSKYSRRFVNKAFFFDRDGILIKLIYGRQEHFYKTLNEIQQLEFQKGIFNLLRTSQKKRYLNLLISNQPDIGLKKIKKDRFEQIKAEIDQRLTQEKVILKGQYYCFHHPSALIPQYRKNCICRKPKPGMLLKATEKYRLNLALSYFLGDRYVDILAGKRAGCQTILYLPKSNPSYLRMVKGNFINVKPDFLVHNLNEVKLLIK